MKNNRPTDRGRRERRLRRWTGLTAAAVGSAALVAIEAGIPDRVLNPMPETTGGNPYLTGVWTARPPARIDGGRAAALPSQLAEVVRHTARTATGFRGETQPGPGIRTRDGATVTSTAARRALAREHVRMTRSEADDPEDRNTWERCITRSLPPGALPEAQANRWLIVQTPRVIALHGETLHETRLLQLDGTTGPRLPQWLGQTHAAWTSGALVATTTDVRDPAPRIAPADPMPGTHPGPTTGMRIDERWLPVHRNRIDYRMTVTDPATWTRPAIYETTLERATEETILEYACHEGNRSLELIFRGARHDRRASVKASAGGARLRTWLGHPTAAPGSRPFLPLGTEPERRAN